MGTEPAQFLDVPTLLERSEPRPRPTWTWYLIGSFIVLGLLGGSGGAHPTPGQVVVRAMSGLLMVGLMAATGGMIWVALRRFRTEQHELQAVEELIQLRRWSEAAVVVQGILGRPARSAANRVHALIFLASVLARYHRFGDALAVHEYLLEHVQLDPAGEYGLKLGRAMAMLREDHLLDADRAIGQLRKLSAAGQGSGGLALVEIYRDVKTGHAAEAVEIFNKRLTVMRDQLGSRVADAYALVARAYDVLGRGAEAQAAWADATVLSPADELVRRYPEVAPVAARYGATVVPAEVGGGRRMIAADYAIARTRRDLTVGAMIRYALVVGAAAAVLLTGVTVGVVFIGLMAAWVALAYRTAVGTRLAAESPALIASGQYDEAERRIELAVRSFIPSRAAKVTNLYHLAALRHAQRRWPEAAELSRAVLRFRPTAALAGVLRGSRLTLAESLLEAGDVRGAHDAIAGLYAERLTLSEAMNLLAVQLDYESRVGAWEQMVQGVASKVQLAELLPAERSARAQALLALAAHRTGRADLAQFLRRRAELLADVTQLVARRRVLSELWPAGGTEIESPAGVGTTMNDEADGGPRAPGVDGDPAAGAPEA